MHKLIGQQFLSQNIIEGLGKRYKMIKSRALLIVQKWLLAIEKKGL